MPAAATAPALAPSLRDNAAVVSAMEAFHVPATVVACFLPEPPTCLGMGTLHADKTCGKEALQSSIINCTGLRVCLSKSTASPSLID